MFRRREEDRRRAAQADPPGQLLKTTIAASLLATGIQGGYYAMFTWIPTYLKTERDLTVVGTSGYLFVVIAGAFLGYLTAGLVHDRLGRRKTFALFASLAGTALVLYFLVPRARTRRCCSSASRWASSPRAASRASAPTCRSCSRRAPAAPAEASVTTSAAASGRCSRASSASSPRRSGSAARSRSACSATCSRSPRWRCCRRPTGGSRDRRVMDSRRAARRSGLRPRAAALRRAPRPSRRTSRACPCRCTAGTSPGRRVAHERVGAARHGRALRHPHRRALPPGRGRRLHGGVAVDAGGPDLDGLHARSGIGHVAPLVRRGVLLDVARRCSRPMARVAEELEALRGVELRPGDVALVRLGSGAVFGDPAAYEAAGGVTGEASAGWPSASRCWSAPTTSPGTRSTRRDPELGSSPATCPARPVGHLHRRVAVPRGAGRRRRARVRVRLPAAEAARRHRAHRSARSRSSRVGDEHVARGVGDHQLGRLAAATACGVTPQAQNTGTSPSRSSTASP